VKRIGWLVALTVAEYESLVCRCEDAEAHAADFAEELSRMQASRRGERKVAFYAGKFAASGGYGRWLKDTKAKLVVTKAALMLTLDQLARWRPFVECLETYPGEITDYPNEMSDLFAAAEFAEVGAQVAKERGYA